MQHAAVALNKGLTLYPLSVELTLRPLSLSLSLSTFVSFSCSLTWPTQLEMHCEVFVSEA